MKRLFNIFNKDSNDPQKEITKESKKNTGQKLIDQYISAEKEITKESKKNTGQKLIDQYISAEKDIKYMQDKYDDFILRSLEVEYDQYKQYVDMHYPNIPDRSLNNWMFTKLEYDKFTLSKSSTDGRKSEITLYVSYSFYKGELEIKHVSVSVNWNAVTLKESKFKEIISSYFLYWKVKDIEKSRESNKESFQKLVDIIGKDVKRDALIDQILTK